MNGEQNHGVTNPTELVRYWRKRAEAAERENVRLRGALDFYADEDKYRWSSGPETKRGVIQAEDRGARAREALGGSEPLVTYAIVARGGYVGTIGPMEKLIAAGQEVVPVEGDAVKRADYPELFAVIGTKYGAAGDDEFRLPDLRGQ